MNEKSDYVKKQKQTRPHTCHWPRCKKQVPPAMWGCKPHWFKLPIRLRNNIWAYYRQGQEKNFTPSGKYLNAAEEAQEWIKENGGFKTVRTMRGSK